MHAFKDILCSIFNGFMYYRAVEPVHLDKKYQNDLIITFFMSIIICGILEYFTSFFMEKIFNARWWDYSKRKFNINGRVCLENLVLFGIASCFIIYVTNQFIINKINKIPPNSNILLKK